MDIPTVRAICARVVELGRHAVQGDIAANVATIRAEIPYDALVDSIKEPAGFRPGPNALLWGLPRSGTSWLHWHLFRDANVTKSAFKEINFLHTIGIAEGYFGQEGAAIDWAIAYDRLAAQYTQWLDDDFLGYAIRDLVFLLGPRDWDWYRLLTGGYGETKGIDLTPLNYLMTQATASHVKEIGPGVLTFALLRDPLEQIVSFWRHELHKTHALTDDGVYVQAHDVGQWLWGRRLRAIIGELQGICVCSIMTNSGPILRACSSGSRTCLASAGSGPPKASRSASTNLRMGCACGSAGVQWRRFARTLNTWTASSIRRGLMSGGAASIAPCRRAGRVCLSTMRCAGGVRGGDSYGPRYDFAAGLVRPLIGFDLRGSSLCFFGGVANMRLIVSSRRLATSADVRSSLARIAAVVLIWNTIDEIQSAVSEDRDRRSKRSKAIAAQTTRSRGDGEVLPVALYDGAKAILSVVNRDRRDGCFAGALLCVAERSVRLPGRQSGRKPFGVIEPIGVGGL